MFLFLLIATVTSSKMKNCFSGCYSRPPTPSRLHDVALLHVPASWYRLGLEQRRHGASFLMSLSFCWRCEEWVPGSSQNPGSLLRALIDLEDLHHLHVSHHGDGLRCPELTLSFMILSNPCFHPCNLKYICFETNIPYLRIHSLPWRPPCSRL